jgi:exopolysaccharide biosynthesis protein
MLVLYGPFTKLKEIYVTSAMTTLSHKYLATMFLSEAEINDIISKNQVSVIDQDAKAVSISHDKKSSATGVKVIDIKNTKFKANLLIIDDPSRLKVGISSKLGEQGASLEEIIKFENAVGGINAGGFTDKGMSGHGGDATGVIVKDSKVVFHDKNPFFSFIGFDSTDRLILESKMSIEAIKTRKIRDGISFGPFLVINGKPMITSGDGGWGIAPRSAIGQTKDGKILLLSVDGRRTDSIGASLKDIQNILLEYGAYNAANLDGGSSTTLIYNSKLINKPSDILGQRSIPSAFIIK